METFLEINLIFLWIVALVNLILTITVVLSKNTKPLDSVGGLKKGEIAPDFVSNNLNGEEVNYSSYSGGEAVFLFVSPRCHACHDLIHNLRTMSTSDAYARGVNIVIVIDATIEEAKVWVENEKIQFPVLVAPRANNTFFNDYNIQGTPSYCHVNKHKKVESSGYPDMDKGLWEKITSSVIFDY